MCSGNSQAEDMEKAGELKTRLYRRHFAGPGVIHAKTKHNITSPVAMLLMSVNLGGQVLKHST